MYLHPRVQSSCVTFSQSPQLETGMVGVFLNIGNASTCAVSNGPYLLKATWEHEILLHMFARGVEVSPPATMAGELYLRAKRSTVFAAACCHVVVSACSISLKICKLLMPASSKQLVAPEQLCKRLLAFACSHTNPLSYCRDRSKQLHRS